MRWLRRRRPDPKMSQVLALLDAGRMREVDALLRHPSGTPRCACGRYWTGIATVISRDGTAHAERMCQPDREVIW